MDRKVIISIILVVIVVLGVIYLLVFNTNEYSGPVKKYETNAFTFYYPDNANLTVYDDTIPILILSGDLIGGPYLLTNLTMNFTPESSSFSTGNLSAGGLNIYVIPQGIFGNESVVNNWTNLSSSDKRKYILNIFSDNNTTLTESTKNQTKITIIKEGKSTTYILTKDENTYFILLFQGTSQAIINRIVNSFQIKN